MTSWFLSNLGFLKCNLYRYAPVHHVDPPPPPAGVAAWYDNPDKKIEAAMVGPPRRTLTPPDPHLKGAWYP